MAAKVVGRGYVVVYCPKPPHGAGVAVTAVQKARADAERLQRKVGGRIVDAKGMHYRMAQGGTIRVLVNPDQAKAL